MPLVRRAPQEHNYAWFFCLLDLHLRYSPITGQRATASFSDSASMHADETHGDALPDHSLYTAPQLFRAFLASRFPASLQWATHRVELSQVTAAVCTVSVSFMGLHR